ncbi:hypothetical protein AMTRI_Chr03g139770 [Amborella trichopoda]
MESSIAITLQNPSFLASKTHKKDIKKWNPIFKRLAKERNDPKILKLYKEIEELGITVDSSSLPIVLKACSNLQALEIGRRIHFDPKYSSFLKDIHVATSLIDFYCNSGLHDEARKVFNGIHERDIVSYNAMISGFMKNHKPNEALTLLSQMQRDGKTPNSVTLVLLLLACNELLEHSRGKEIHCDSLRGREIHCYSLRNGLFESNIHLGTALICFYARLCIFISRFVFDSMRVRSVATWNAMINGYTNSGMAFEALKLFVSMQLSDFSVDSATLLPVLQSCLDVENFEFGEQVHQLGIKHGFQGLKFIETSLINFYSKSGKLKSACQVFDRLQSRDIASWNAMISAYTHWGCHEEAISLFTKMQVEGIKGDSATFGSMFTIFSYSRGLDNGKAIHGYVIKSGMDVDVLIGNALLSLYGECNCLEASLSLFTNMRETDIVSWNTVILTYAREGMSKVALNLYKELEITDLKPNCFTMVAILEAFSDEPFLSLGKSVHAHIIRHGFGEGDPQLWTALVDMYMNCGDPNMARALFESRSSSTRDVVMWNAMIAGYVDNDLPKDALSLFHSMIEEKQPIPNSVTMINVLPSCALLAALQHGKCIHAYLLRCGLDSKTNASIDNALITMYAKSGSMEHAKKLFDRMVRRDIISYNAMIACYGMHGHIDMALSLFSQMQKEGLRPTGVTFVLVLSACSHGGLIKKGWEFFESMFRDYGIEHEVVHYSCMVDLLGRAGHLDEARNFIESMPIKPDASLCRALLGACRVYPNIEMAIWASTKLFELEPDNAGNYVLLSNIYAATGHWNIVKMLRLMIRYRGLKKDPGSSWICLRNQVHAFTAGNKSHPQRSLIHAKLEDLNENVSEMGYVPDTSSVFYELGDFPFDYQ